MRLVSSLQSQPDYGSPTTSIVSTESLRTIATQQQNEGDPSAAHTSAASPVPPVGLHHRASPRIAGMGAVISRRSGEGRRNQQNTVIRHAHQCHTFRCALAAAKEGRSAPPRTKEAGRPGARPWPGPPRHSSVNPRVSF